MAIRRAVVWISDILIHVYAIQAVFTSPFISQIFCFHSVVGNKFVSDPVNFSNKSTTFGDAFSDFSSRSSKGTLLLDSHTS